MTYVIIAIYDGGYGFSTCINGRHYPGYNIYEKESLDCKAYREHNWKEFCEYIKTKYKNYDFIVICDDANIVVLKEEKRNGSETKV